MYIYIYILIKMNNDIISKTETFENITLDSEFDEMIDKLYMNHMSYLLNENNDSLYIQLDKSFDFSQKLDEILKQFFDVNEKIHKNMHNDDMCKYQIKKTLDDEINYENNINGMYNKLTKNEGDRGRSNTCMIRLNNVKSFNNNNNNNNNNNRFIIKRLTRFKITDKYDYNFIGSNCPNWDLNVNKDINKKSNLREDECEFRELFNCIVLSHYLIKHYGDICPKIYGLFLVPKKDPYVKNEIYIIQEQMNKTVDVWLSENKTEDELKNFVNSMIKLDFVLHNKKIPTSLVNRFDYIFYPKANNNHLEWVKQDLYLAFYDCKYDNIMIDFNGNWRIIDIDGIIFTEQNNIDKQDKNPSTCIFNNCDLGVNYPFMSDELKKALNVNNIPSLEKIVNQYNDADIQNLGGNNYINIIKTIIDIIKKQYFNLNINNLMIGVGYNNIYYNKYLKYKNKYVELKKRLK